MKKSKLTATQISKILNEFEDFHPLIVNMLQSCNLQNPY